MLVRSPYVAVTARGHQVGKRSVSNKLNACIHRNGGIIAYVSDLQ